MSDPAAASDRLLCPRCGRSLDPAGFYGPCQDCRTELRATMCREPEVVAVAPFEPAMHVVPNQVATKD